MKRKAARLLSRTATTLLRWSIRLDPPEKPRPVVVVPRPRASIVQPVGSTITFETDSLRFVRGGRA